MKKQTKFQLVAGAIVVCVLSAWGIQAVAIEEPNYDVLVTDKPFEIRAYPGYVQASVVVDEEFKKAGNSAFRVLVGYIGGDNVATKSIKMTAPVTQQAVTDDQGAVEGAPPLIAPQESSQKIKMTAPVIQSPQDEGYKVAFVMPEKWTLATLPQPTDPRITLEAVPAREVAVIRYRGNWSQDRYHAHLAKLQDWVASQQRQAVGEPVWARYNPPITPSFFRRNEILIEIAPKTAR